MVIIGSPNLITGSGGASCIGSTFVSSFGFDDTGKDYLGSILLSKTSSDLAKSSKVYSSETIIFFLV